MLQRGGGARGWSGSASLRPPLLPALLPVPPPGTAVILRAMSASGYLLPSAITLAGGAARSELWLQIHADMSGVPLRLTR